MKTIIVAKSTQVGEELARKLGMKRGTYLVPDTVESLKGIQGATVLMADGWDQRKDISVADLAQALDTMRMFGSLVLRLSKVSKVPAK